MFVLQLTMQLTMHKQFAMKLLKKTSVRKYNRWRNKEISQNQNKGKNLMRGQSRKFTSGTRV